MPSGRHPARRRGVAQDSDPDSEDGYTAEPSEAQKLETLKAIAMADLGSTIRDFITSVDYRDNKRPNKRLIMNDRDCNKEGTEASERVERNRPATKKWNNFGNTDDAKKGVVEQLDDICGGQTHRQNVKAKLLAEAAALGREPTLEDMNDERRRRAGIPPSRTSRGGSHAAAANDRGHFAGGRGGGNVGRGSGRAPAPAPSSGNRPLDPAVDPDRVYTYKDKGPRFDSGAGKTVQRGSTTTMVNNTVRVTPSAPAAMAKTKATKEKSSFAKPLPSATTATQKLLSTPAQSNAAGSSSRGSALFPRNPAPRLAESNDFMAFAKNMVSRAKKAPNAPPAFSATSAEAAGSKTGLLASKFAPSAASTAAKENVAPIQRLNREEFRDPDMSPAELTDALPSTGQLSMTSPSVESETIINDSHGGVGLGISITGDGYSHLPKQDAPNKSPLPHNPDLMDIEIPEVKKEVLLPSPARKASAEEMASISKAELDKWNTIKALMQAGDTTGLMEHLTLEGPTQPTKASVPTQPIKVSFPTQSTKPTTPKDDVQVANGYAVNATKIDIIIGNQKNWPKGVATQTTPSLAASKWASGPKLAVSLPQKSKGQGATSMPNPADGAHATSPITISSSSSSSYHSSVEHIMTQPVVQNVESKSFMPKSRVNPFIPRETTATATDNDVILDYGEPPKLKPMSNGTAAKAVQAILNTSVLTPAQQEIQAQRERMKADMQDQLGIPATLKQKAKPALVVEDRKAGARLQEQKEVNSLSKEDGTMPPAASRPILKPIAPSSAAGLRSGTVRAGLTGSKWATAQPAPPVRPAPTASSSVTVQPASPVKPALTTSKWATAQPTPPLKSTMTTPKWATPQATSAVKPTSTTSTGVTARPTPAAKSALMTSKWATAQSTSPVKSVATLEDRSPNKSSRKAPKKPDSPIFGDAKVVSHLPYTASSTSSTVNEKYPPPRKDKAIKHTAPGAGYDRLMRETAPMKLGSSSTPPGTKAAEANSALAEAKGIAQQFGVDEGDSTDSEL